MKGERRELMFDSWRGEGIKENGDEGGFKGGRWEAKFRSVESRKEGSGMYDVHTHTLMHLYRKPMYKHYT
jgi:hypothetical protein